METFNINEHPLTRRNLHTGDWVLVSPHRNTRLWHGKVEPLPQDDRPPYDSACYLCLGNMKAN